MANEQAEMNRDITPYKLQLQACSSDVAEFDELLHKFAEAPSPERNENGQRMSGLKYIELAIEKGGITEFMTNGSQRFTSTSLKFKEEKQAAIEAYVEENLRPMEKLMREIEQQKKEIASLRDAFTEAVSGLSETIQIQTADLDAQAEEIKVLRAAVDRFNNPSL